MVVADYARPNDVVFFKSAWRLGLVFFQQFHCLYVGLFVKLSLINAGSETFFDKRKKIMNCAFGGGAAP